MRDVLNGMILALMLAMVGPVAVTAHKPASGACVEPSFTNIWAAYNPANLCGTTGASSCTTNGQIFFQATDLAGSNNANQTSTANQPIYATNAVNTTLPALIFNGASAALNISTPIPASVTTYTFYAVINLTVAPASVMLGPTGGGGLIWYINLSGNQQIDDAGTAPLGTGTGVYTAGTWYAIAVELNTSTSTYAFFNCSGGTCASDGSGSIPTTTLTNSVTFIGFDQRDTLLFNGKFAELAYLNGNSVAGVGAYVNCKYGI